MRVTPSDAGLVGLSKNLGRFLMGPIGEKLLGVKVGFCTFSTVFNFFEGHALTLADSKGRIRILLFRGASFGTGPVRVRPWEGQNTSNPLNFGK